MSEQHSNRTVWFVSSGAAGDANGSQSRPFASTEDALAAFSRRAEKDGSRQTGFELEIICIDQPAVAPSVTGSPEYQYFVDPFQGSEQADGSESAPWPSLSQATRELAVLHGETSLRLKPGQRLRLSRQEVFAATPIERRKKHVETFAKIVFMIMAFALVLPVVAILAYLTVEAWPALSVDFLLTNPRKMGSQGGIWAPLVGTFMLVLVTMLLATPIGVLAGVYLNEYAPDNWLTRIINLAVVNLAGVPSIVHGLFGFGAFVIFANMGKSMFAAACTLAVMTLPVIITSTREALASVPRPFRVACWNMGATRWQTIRTVVLPNSISGILTGVILQVSRAAGETAPILFTGVATFMRVPDTGWKSFLPFGLDEPFMALSMHLYTIRTQVTNVPEEVQFGTAVVLIGLVLAVNSVSIAFRVYLRSRKKW